MYENNNNTNLVSIQVPEKFAAAILAYACSLEDGKPPAVLSERLESIGIKLTKEIEKLINDHPENLEYAIACCGETWVKNPLAVFKKRLVKGGEVRSHSLATSNPDNTAKISQGRSPNIQSAQMVLVQEIMKEAELIDYKATEWKTDPKSGFHHKELEFVKADVIASYLNNPIRLELDRAAMSAVRERKQREFEREQAEIARLKAIDDEVKALTPEQRQSNIDKIKAALRFLK